MEEFTKTYTWRNQQNQSMAITHGLLKIVAQLYVILNEFPLAPLFPHLPTYGSWKLIN